MNSFGEYGTAEPMQSSTAVLQFSNEESVSYALGMHKNAPPDTKPAPFGFGARLKAARQEKKLTQAQLGELAGENGKDANKQSIFDWESERYYPKVDQLRVMCLRLGVSADDLIFGDLKKQVAMAQAQSAVKQLTEEQRMALLATMMGPALSDKGVEQRIPITKAPAFKIRSSKGKT